MTLQHTALSQKLRPAVKVLRNTALPLTQGSKRLNEATVKNARQKVTSKLRADSKCRVTTPAVDHIKVTMTIKSTARLWLNFITLPFLFRKGSPDVKTPRNQQGWAAAV
jgi:hypothetical protein